MALPDFLQTAIDELCSKINLQSLQAHAQELSSRYRDLDKRSPYYMDKEGHRLAYLAARFPATYAVIKNVLQMAYYQEDGLKSLLDVGSGPGTAIWAAREIVPDLQRLTAIEQDKALIELGKSLEDKSDLGGLIRAKWLQMDLREKSAFEAHDLVILSYALGELPEEGMADLINALWKATNKTIVIIEPGTPRGFSRIREAREILKSLGAIIAAPCPHQDSCPISGTDWCHFSQRIDRSFSHRFVKFASLNYEDEKFSYIVAKKNYSSPCATSMRSRILRHPLKHTGHVRLKLCTNDGIQNKIISRKDKELYKLARKAEWGEEF